MKKILCFIGWHRWTWNLREAGGVITDSIPDIAKCSRCGEKYVES